jgi:uncharacterized caspase-like protein
MTVTSIFCSRLCATALITWLTVFAAPAPVGAESNSSAPRYALLIANAAYPEAAGTLPTSIKDANSLAAELKRLGFDVDLKTNLNKADTDKALNAFLNKINKGATALFYFSGFGIQSSKQNYLIPTDAQIWTEAEVGRDGTSIDSILTRLSQKGAGVKLMIIDAARQNPYERRFRAVAAGLAAVNLPDDALITYAAATNKIADDFEGAPNSALMAQLLNEIRTPAISAEAAFNRTRVDVSRGTNGDQVPWVSSTMLDEFSFNPQTSGTSVNTQNSVNSVNSQNSGNSVNLQNAGNSAGKSTESNVVANQGADAKVARTDKADTTTPNTTAPPSKGQDSESQAAKPVGTKTFAMASSQDPDIKKLSGRIAENPKDAAAYYNRGQIYAKNGDISRAVADFNQAIGLDPKDAAAFNNRCWVRATSGDLDLALRDCNEAMRLRPNYADAFDSRGLVYLKLNLNGNAVADYDVALGLKANLASSLYGRGIAKLRSGNSVEGNNDIAAAKKIEPNIAADFAGYGIAAIAK